MPCEHLKIDGAHAIVCTRNQRRRRCSSCHKLGAGFLCDYPVTRKKSGTCDKALCSICAVIAGDPKVDKHPKHHCPDHPLQSSAQPSQSLSRWGHTIPYVGIGKGSVRATIMPPKGLKDYERGLDALVDQLRAWHRNGSPSVRLDLERITDAVAALPVKPSKKPWVKTYPDPKSDKWEERAADDFALAWARSGMNGRPLDEPVVLLVTATFPRPKSKTLKTRPNLRYLHTVKPDGSNVLKAVEDALVKGGVLRDDSRIADTRCVKFVAGDCDQVGVTVRLRWGRSLVLFR